MEPKTLFDVLIRTYRRIPAREAFVYRAGGEEFRVSFEKFFDDVLLLARAFRHKRIHKGDRVMFLSDNRYSWMVTDMALVAIGAVSVPRGSDTPTAELQYIMEHASCSHLVIETAELYQRHQEMIDALPGLKMIFLIEGGELHKPFQRLYSYQDLLHDRTISAAELASFVRERDHLEPDDVVTLIYTSGTTGKPKGVPLTHRNLLHQISVLPPLAEITEEDCWVSILPAWHIFERMIEYLAVAQGSCIVYSTLKTFADDLVTYRPTLVGTVPRLWESLYDKVNAAVDKQGKGKLFRAMIAISAGYRRHRREFHNELPRFVAESPVAALLRRGRGFLGTLCYAPLYPLAQKKLAPVRDKFGGRLRNAISGGGSLPPHIDAWIDAIGIRIINAYGLTETSPCLAARGINCDVFGTIGPPVSQTEMRIADEEGNVLPAGREGEVQVRGPQVMSGYFDNPEENARSFTSDGWFRTGDLGKMTITGELVLCGRSKEIIVLANGENVDPTRIEAAISQLPFVADAVLVGQDKKGLGALIVPDRDRLKDFIAETFNVALEETEIYLHDKRLIQRVKQEMNRLLHPKQGFKPHERLQDISFLDKEFTTGDELTNTYKKKRHVIEKKYRDLINRLLK